MRLKISFKFVIIFVVLIFLFSLSLFNFFGENVSFGPIPNTMTIENKDNSPIVNRPVKVGRIFEKGEIPNGFYPTINIGNMPVDTQVDLKNRWEDGSLKYAIISFILPNLDVGETKTLTFSNVDSSNYLGNVPLVPPVGFFVFDAEMVLTSPTSSAGTHTILAKTMLANNDIEKIWMEGPIVSSVVLADHTAGIYDVGWKQDSTKIVSGSVGNSLNQYVITASSTLIYVEDASWISVNQILNLNDELIKVQSINTNTIPHEINVLRNQGGVSAQGAGTLDYVTALDWKPLGVGDEQYKSFRPIYIIDFWNTGDIQVRFIGEIANTEKLQDLTYNLALNIVDSNGVTQNVLTQNDITQHVGTRWTRAFWNDGDLPKIEINHNKDYVSNTGIIFTYDSSINVPESEISTTYNGWQNSERGLMDKGLYSTRRMGDGGNRMELSYITGWDALWITSMDSRMEEISTRHGELAGSWPVHYREGDSSKVFDRDFNTGVLGSLSGLGKVITPNGRPKLTLTGPYWNGISLQDRLNFVSRHTNGGAHMTQNGVIVNSNQDWEIKKSHFYNPNAISYLFTGDYWHLEQMQFWSSFTTLFDTTARGPTDNDVGQAGGLMDTWQIRSHAKPMNVRLYASVFSEDGSPEKEHFDNMVYDAIVAWMGMQDIPLSDELRIPQTPWNLNLWNFARNRFASYQTPSNSYLSLPSPLNYWIYGSSGSCDSPVEQPPSGNCITPWMYNMLIITLGIGDNLGYPMDKLIEYSSGFQSWHFNSGIPEITLLAYRQKTSSDTSSFNQPSQVFNSYTSSYQNSPCSSGSGGNCHPIPYYSHSYFSLALAASSVIYQSDNVPYDWLKNEGASTFAAGTYNKDPRYAIVPNSPPVVSLCGNGVIDSGEQCGEPGLSCSSGYSCSICQCNLAVPNVPSGVSAVLN